MTAVRAVGCYTLLSKLGEGGMGVVHLARHEDSGERVALKVLRPQVVGDDEGRARLAREVSSLSRVRSRWVAGIVDSDPWGEVPFVATRYVPGLSLFDQVAQDGPVTGRDLHWLARCLAEGIASCHEVGVLHRDVKPSNVLMEGRTPILIDFGLARVADDPKITHTGWLLGTPGYLPPEILHGQDASPASDVHSWAATVAYAATGRPPFGRGPSTAIMDRARRGEFDLSGVPGPLATVLASCLAPDPAARPSLAAVLDWLRDPSLPLPAGDAVTAALAPATLVERAEPTAVDSWAAGEPSYPIPDETPAGVGVGERLRRGVLWLALAALCGVGFAAFPWVATALVVALVWLLRAGSMAATDVAARRVARGRKWYDGPRLILGAPWDLVRSVPSTLVLLLWALGLSVAAALLCYAVTAPVGTSLMVCGTVFAVTVALGPGGDHVRRPLGGVIRPLASAARRWLPAIVILAAVLVALGLMLSSRGSDWLPAHDAPISALR